MSDYQPELQLAEQAARAAGELLREMVPGKRKVDSAHGRDIKLAADRESESIILDHLRNNSRFPILSEERGLSNTIAAGQPYWIVDPIDGTMNYLRDIKLCCISIALWQDDKPLLGVIYDFVGEEMFSALVGTGAWCNGQAMRVSANRDTSQSILSTGFPVWRDFSADALNTFVAQVQSFKKVRMLGTAALSLAYVASGKVDAYQEDGIQLWDVAAGLALVKAAGGWYDCQAASDQGYLKNVRAGAHPDLFT